MLCESCHQREASVHLTKTVFRKTEVSGDANEKQAESKQEQHFCTECADAYLFCTPGMNSARHLICLSDSYRTKLYDLLERVHPEAFDNSDDEACRRGSQLMQNFLREHLKKDGIGVNEDAFGMLCSDFFGSHHFYSRMEEY